MDQVTYVVDADLIRFAKFALSILAIFIIVGISLFGFNLKNMAQSSNGARLIVWILQSKWIWHGMQQ